MRPSSALIRMLCRRLSPLLLTVLSAWLLIGAFRPVLAQSPPAQQDPMQIKSHLKEVMTRPEFAPVSTGDSPLQQFSKWIQKQWDSFWRWVRGLFRSSGIGGIGTVGNGGVMVFTIVFSVLGLALVGWLIYKFVIYIRNRNANSRTAFDMDDPAEAMITEPNAWLNQAENFAGENDYRRAFRAVFLAILLQLDQAGVIEFDRSRTNGDYLRLLRGQGQPVLYDTLRPLVFEFDLRWYGNKPTDEADYRHCLTEYHRIRQILALQAEPMSSAQQAAPAAGEV